MSARNTGHRVGGAVGWVGAKIVSGTIRVAVASGNFGEGFLDGAEEKYVSTRLADEAAAAQRRVLMLAAMAAAKPQTQAVAMPVGG
jgi:hypothetical protein